MGPAVFSFVAAASAAASGTSFAGFTVTANVVVPIAPPAPSLTVKVKLSATVSESSCA